MATGGHCTDIVTGEDDTLLAFGRSRRPAGRQLHGQQLALCISHALELVVQVGGLRKPA